MTTANTAQPTSEICFAPTARPSLQPIPAMPNAFNATKNLNPKLCAGQKADESM